MLAAWNRDVKRDGALSGELKWSRDDGCEAARNPDLGAQKRSDLEGRGVRNRSEDRPRWDGGGLPRTRGRRAAGRLAGRREAPLAVARRRSRLPAAVRRRSPARHPAAAPG